MAESEVIESIEPVSTTFLPDSANNTCVITSRIVFQSAWGIFSGIAATVNIFVLVCMIKSWGILRQNITYCYVVSCSLSSITFSLFAIYEVIVTSYNLDIYHLITLQNGSLKYNASIADHDEVMKQSAFRKGLLPALHIIIQLNIVALIFGVSDNAFFVGRYGNQTKKTRSDRPRFHDKDRPRSQNLFSNRTFSWKKCKAVLVICLSWALPLMIIIPVPLGWNCIQHCTCLPIITEKPYCVASDDSEEQCSRLWHPMSSSFIAVITGVSFAAMVLMFALLVNTIRKFYRIHTPPESTTVNNRPRQDIEIEGIRNYAERSNSYHGHTSTNPTDLRTKAKVGSSLRNMPVELGKPAADAKITKEASTSSVSALYHRRRLPPLDPVVKMLIVLSVCSFIAVFPLMTVWLLDSVVPADTAAELPFVITSTLSMLYASTLPCILVKYMTGLRKSINIVIMKFPCFGTTVITVVKKTSTPETPQPVGVQNSTTREEHRADRVSSGGISGNHLASIPTEPDVAWPTEQ